MVISRIEEDEGDRVLLYTTNYSFYVIASPKEARNLNIGDTIDYEPYGANFGWFVAKRIQNRTPLGTNPEGEIKF